MAGIRSAYHALHVGYGLGPLLAGADKFTNLLCDWESYLSPTASRLIPVKDRTFMRLVGVIEMAVGGMILSRRFRRTGAYIASGWLTAIAGNLVLGRRYDIAVRDLEMALASFALAKIDESLGAPKHEQPRLREGIEQHAYKPPVATTPTADALL